MWPTQFQFHKTEYTLLLGLYWACSPCLLNWLYKSTHPREPVVSKWHTTQCNYLSEVHITSDSTKMTTYQGDSAVYKLDLKQAASLLSDNSYPIYTIFVKKSVSCPLSNFKLTTTTSESSTIKVNLYLMNSEPTSKYWLSPNEVLRHVGLSKKNYPHFFECGISTISENWYPLKIHFHSILQYLENVRFYKER